jgi:glutamate-1-semialdehyde 2,1-aminomutase
MGVGANLLGYCDEDVDNAVIDAIRKGVNTTLNAPEEVELAELLLDIHPWAESVRYTKTGGEAMSVAVRVARASTKRDKVLFCGYHGWHDWYISSNLSSDQALDGHLLSGLQPAGVPRALKGTSFPFTYNNTQGFLDLINAHDGEIACVVLESVRNFEPDPEFFATIRKITKEKGIVLILDEITAGFRMNIGGAHLRYGLVPDIAVFGKAFSNGYPMGALVGKKEIMEAAQSSFISSLFWTERTGLVAALATVKKMIATDSPSTITSIGNEVQANWKRISEDVGVDINIMGMPAISAFAFKVDKPLVAKTYLTQEMLKKGYLATVAFYASCAHKDSLEGYFNAFEEVLMQIKNISDRGDNLASHLQGEVCHAGFKRLT